MAQPIYSTSVQIPSFSGLNQAGDGHNISMQYAVDMENVNVKGGSFQPMREGKLIPQMLDEPIGTLAYLHRRYGENTGTLLVAISDGCVYTKDLDGDDEWVKRYPAEGQDALTVSDCDWLTYETSEYPVYNASKTYVKGERCKHKAAAPDPESVCTGIDVYTCLTTGSAEPWNPARWTAWNVNTNESGNLSNFFPFYSSSETYSVGEYVAVDVTEGESDLRDYKLYMCTTDITTPEEWTAAHWQQKNIASTYDETHAYLWGNSTAIERYEKIVPEYDDTYKYYSCNTDITTPQEWTASNWDELETNDPIDILLFTNATDGMFCLYGDNQNVSPVWITPDPENNPDENIKFGVIARYNERIWGSAIAGDPDKLMYSCPYNPFDWTANNDIPEDGAGDILQPTWDGDLFVSLRQIGSDLLAVKRNSIWRIYGTHPGEFVMVQMYGGGTIQENTVAIQDQYMFMLGEHGIMRYNGTGAYAFLQDAVQRLMRDQVNHAALNNACAAMRNGVYCLALPINGSEFCNAVLEYDPNEQTFALRTSISVDSFLQYNERLFYTSAVEPGRVFELTDEVGLPLPCKWISGYQDLGLKNSIKSAFILYMMVDSEAPVELRVGLRTEKKFKQKVIYTKPNKMTRLHLNTQGRQFRLEIQSYSGIPFTIAGGIKLDLELDPD